MSLPGTLETRQRVRNGRRREGQIADALKQQHGLNLVEPTDHEDKIRKIDRWLVDGTSRTAVQIKYRESGDDLLVEVFDRWDGWNGPRNKIGRDVQGDSKLYAVLRTDRQTVVLTSAAVLKGIVNEMVEAAKTIGWTVDNGPSSKTLRYFKAGGRCELKVQTDPYDGRTKMVAYIPANVLIFENQAKTYKVRLPKEWQD
jgi:hypothetical protein